MVLKPAKCGCEGCYYEGNDNCPGDNEPRLSACTDKEKGAMIFVEGDKDE